MRGGDRAEPAEHSMHRVFLYVCFSVQVRDGGQTVKHTEGYGRGNEVREEFGGDPQQERT